MSCPPTGLPSAASTRLHEALANLLANAVQHSSRRANGALRCHTSDSWVQIEITDTGEGIPADHLPRVFERFYRVDQARSRDTGGIGIGIGIGIGLTITRALLKAEGGHIQAQSPGPGQGTTFVISLPRFEL